MKTFFFSNINQYDTHTGRKLFFFLPFWGILSHQVYFGKNKLVDEVFWLF